MLSLSRPAIRVSAYAVILEAEECQKSLRMGVGLNFLVENIQQKGGE
jgi:hypothetical protein